MNTDKLPSRKFSVTAFSFKSHTSRPPATGLLERQPFPLLSFHPNWELLTQRRPELGDSGWKHVLNQLCVHPRDTHVISWIAPPNHYKFTPPFYQWEQQKLNTRQPFAQDGNHCDSNKMELAAMMGGPLALKENRSLRDHLLLPGGQSPSSPVSVIYFHSLGFRLRRPEKGQGRWGRKWKFCVNPHLYHKTCLKCQPCGFAGVSMTEVGLKVRLNWTSNPQRDTWKRLLKKEFPAGTRWLRQSVAACKADLTRSSLLRGA